MILLCVDFIVLLSQNICLKEKLCYIMPIYFFPNYYKKNGKIIYKYFKDKYDRS